MRRIALVSLLMLLFFSSIGVLADDDDTSVGDFAQDTVNDPPVFTDWYDSATLIDPGADVIFYATVVDVDNSSDELNLTLYYSNDTFGANNYSLEMSFSSQQAINTYRFTLLFAGEDTGTYYQYYYSAFDNGTIVKKPAEVGVFFDIQWDLIVTEPPGGVPAPKPPPAPPFVIMPELFTLDVFFSSWLRGILAGDPVSLGLLAFVSLISFCIFFLLIKRRKKEK